jgi:hypothetical protein
LKTHEETTMGVEFWFLGELWFLGFKSAMELWFLASPKPPKHGLAAASPLHLLTCGFLPRCAVGRLSEPGSPLPDFQALMT